MTWLGKYGGTAMVCAVAFFGSACGGSTQAIDPRRSGVNGEIPPEARQACASYRGAFRSWYLRCGGYGYPRALDGALAEKCARHASLPGVTVTPAALTACVTTMGGAGCDSFPAECGHLDEPLQPIPFSSISAYEIFPPSQGTSTEGEACAFADQCQSGQCTGSELRCGFCARDAQPGGACSAFVLCPWSERCEAGQCVPRGETEGKPCQLGPKGGSNCANGLYCRVAHPDDPPFGHDGICTLRLGLGESCHERVVDQECQAGTVCKGSTCRQVKTVAEGEACDYEERFCGAGLVCPNGTCRRHLGDLPRNADCTYGDRCQKGLYCNYGKCVDVPELGDACGGFPHFGTCAAGWCGPNKVCAPLSGLDGPCSHYGPGPSCADGLACVFHPDDVWTCATPAGEGGACPTGTECGLPLRCDEGRCRGPDYCSSEADAE